MICPQCGKDMGHLQMRGHLVLKHKYSATDALKKVEKLQKV